MECPKCYKKTTKLDTSCKSCSMKFCSTNCSVNHYFSIHKVLIKQQQEQEQKNNKQADSSTIKSPYIIEGKLLPSSCFDKEYSLDKMERVYVNKKLMVIGSGTFSKVILYKSLNANSFYAVKHMLKEQVIETSGSLDIIYKEIEIHSRIIHPNIIRLYNVVETPLTFDLVMEHASKGSLFNLIQKTQGLPEEQAFHFFIQTCSAVYFLHSKNLIHRDIKPENLLIDHKGKLKLCDFGWCNDIKREGRSTFCGTIEYMAPEIIQELPYDKSIDIWALGVLLYEMIHGSSPFKADSEVEDGNIEVFKNILDNKIIFYKSISWECKEMILKMIEPDIPKRLKWEDIFNMPFVKKYTKQPQPYNLIEYYQTNDNKANITSKNVKRNIGNDQSTDYINKALSSNQINKTFSSHHHNNNNDSYYDILDELEKKNQPKKKKTPKHIIPKPQIRLEYSDVKKIIHKENKTTLQNLNRSAYMKEDDGNINNEIFLNNTTRDSVKANKKGKTPQLRQAKYDLSTNSLKEAMTLVDLTSESMNGFGYSSVQEKAPQNEKRLTFWQALFKPFICE